MNVKIDLWKALEKADLVDKFYDAITEYITEKTGYCVNAYGLSNKIKLKVYNLDLDTEEN